MLKVTSVETDVWPGATPLPRVTRCCVEAETFLVEGQEQGAPWGFFTHSKCL